jgi:hypothetical protein
MAISWIEHNSKKILFVNFKNLKSEELMQATLEYKKVLLENPSGDLLVLIDFTDSILGGEPAKIAKDAEIQAKEKGIILKTSCTGITGIKKIIAKGVKPNLHIANSIEESKEWLVN